MNDATGAVVALPAEARCLTARRCRPGELCEAGGLLLQVAGVGAERAKRAGEALLAAGACSLLSFGVAAGLAPGLPSGTLLLPDEVVAADGRRLPTDKTWRERWAGRAAILPVRHEALAETSVALVDSIAKRVLAERTGAIAADMESAAVLALAASAGVPALVVRCVLDPLEQTLPAAALAALRDDGSTDGRALALALWRRPSELGALLALARGNRRALRALGLFAGLVRDVADDAARHARQNPPRPTET